MIALARRSFESLAATGILAIAQIQSAYAQFAGPQPNIAGLANNADEGGIRDTIVRLIQSVLSFLALVAVIIVIIAGIRLMTSQGEDEAKDKAKKTIFYAIAGLLIVLFAKVIVGLVTSYIANQVN